MRVFVPDPHGAESYPIVTYSWVLIRKRNPNAAKARAMQELFKWCLTEGQQRSSKLGYVPPPPTVSEKSLAALNGVTKPQ